MKTLSAVILLTSSRKAAGDLELDLPLRIRQPAQGDRSCPKQWFGLLVREILDLPIVVER